jgi:hypothetical protein
MEEAEVDRSSAFSSILGLLRSPHFSFVFLRPLTENVFAAMSVPFKRCHEVEPSESGAHGLFFRKLELA